MAKPHLNPIFLKAGIPLALSLAGYLFCHPRISSNPRISDSSQIQEEIRDSENSCNSNSSSLVGDHDQFLFTDSNDQQCPNEEISDGPKIPQQSTDMFVEQLGDDKPNLIEEVSMLKDRVFALENREVELEMLLLQYHNVRCTVVELLELLETKTVHVEFLRLKVESLEADNQRIEYLLADYPGVKMKLRSTRTKVKLLEKKTKKQSRVNRRRLLKLSRQISVLQASGAEISGDNEELKQRLDGVKVLEDEIQELRRIAVELRKDKDELVQRLEAHTEAADKDGNAADDLRSVNQELLKQLEQLQTDQSSDMDELMYLRRINACLGYELTKNGDQDSEIEKGNQLLADDTECNGGCIDCESQALENAKHSTPTKSRLIHKLKRWAKGKQKSRSLCDEKVVHERLSVTAEVIENGEAARTSCASVKSCCAVD